MHFFSASFWRGTLNGIGFSGTTMSSLSSPSNFGVRQESLGHWNMALQTGFHMDCPHCTGRSRDRGWPSSVCNHQHPPVWLPTHLVSQERWTPHPGSWSLVGPSSSARTENLWGDALSSSNDPQLPLHPGQNPLQVALTTTDGTSLRGLSLSTLSRHGTTPTNHRDVLHATSLPSPGLRVRWRPGPRVVSFSNTKTLHAALVGHGPHWRPVTEWVIKES